MTRLLAVAALVAVFASTGCGAGSGDTAAGTGTVTHPVTERAPEPDRIVTITLSRPSTTGPGPGTTSYRSSPTGPPTGAGTVTPTTPTSPPPSSAATTAGPATLGPTTPAPTSAPTQTAPTQIAATVLIDLSRCEGCGVIAAHPRVVGEFSAVQLRTPTGAMLAAAWPDGTVAGVINIPYGTGFPTPPDGVLPCDGEGRCTVTVTGADGATSAHAFQLDADGGWRDLSAVS